MKFSIVIPTYNEEQSIFGLVDEIFDILINKNKIKNFQIVLVNDSSTDGTLKKFNELKRKYRDKIKIISNELNLGQSFSIIRGIQEADFDTVVTMDADGQNNPKDIYKLLDIYFSNEKVFLVGGIRKKRKDNFIKKISSKIANNVRNFILKDNCSDTGCSLKVFDKETFLKFPKFKGIHRFLPALFTGYKKKSLFIDVDHRPRIHGYSKYGTFDRLFTGIKDLIRVYNIIKKYRKSL